MEMNVWKLAVPVVACAIPLFGTGCVTREVVVERPREVVVQKAPPAEVVEVQTAAPSAEHVWIKGHWHWNGADWQWVRGHWETRRVGYVWIPAHYEQRGGSYAYVPGYWGR
jgi:hypothetical protein